MRTLMTDRLHRTTLQLNARLLRRLKAVRINPARWRILGVLKSYGPLRIGEIADLTPCDQPAASRLIAQLEKENRVLRRWSKTDSRVAQISLTQRGVETLDQVLPAALRLQDLALRDISRKELRALFCLLDRIEHNTRDSGRFVEKARPGLFQRRLRKM